MLRRYVACVILLVALTPGFSHAQERRDREENWAYLGQSHVNGHRDNDKIRVHSDPQSFRAIEFRVEGGEVEFDRILVHFRNGSEADRLMHVRIAAGGRSRAIDLPGDRRIIEWVKVWYHQSNPGRHPAVSLFGLR